MRHLGLAFWMVCLVACVHGTDPTSDAAIDGATADRTETSTDAARDGSVPSDVGTDVVVATDTALDAPIAADAGTDAGSALGFPIIDPPGGYDGLATSPALRVENATARTVSNLSITSDSGDCLVVTGGSDIVLEHLSIGPCAGNGIYLTGNVQRVTIRDVYVHDAVGAGVSGYEAHGVTITDSHFARVSSGAYFDRCDAIRFERNSVLDVRGPFPRGQVIQFNNVRSAGNAVRCNVGENRAGESNPEDAINMFESAGTASDPILIEGNRILGGGPSMSGGGILLGDGAGQYMVARDNTVIDPGQYGIAVAGGDHLTIHGNRVLARQQPFTNVGVYVWDQYNSSCNTIEVSDNRVHWISRDGTQNSYWNGDNCGTVIETGNDFAATLSPDEIHVVPASCR